VVSSGDARWRAGDGSPAGTPAPPLSGAAAAQSWLDGERAALTAVTQYAAWHGWAEHATRLSATLRNYFVYGGHYPEAILINASARLAASQLGDRAAEGAVNALAGQRGDPRRPATCSGRRRTEAAAGHLRTALTLCGELEDHDGEAVALNRLGEVHLADGRPGDARDQLTAALGLATENGNRLEQARARDGLGHAYHALGDTAEASRHWQEALAIYTDLDIPQADQVRARLDGVS